MPKLNHKSLKQWPHYNKVILTCSMRIRRAVTILSFIVVFNVEYNISFHWPCAIQNIIQIYIQLIISIMLIVLRLHIPYYRIIWECLYHHLFSSYCLRTNKCQNKNKTIKMTYFNHLKIERES